MSWACALFRGKEEMSATTAMALHPLSSFSLSLATHPMPPPVYPPPDAQSDALLSNCLDAPTVSRAFIYAAEPAHQGGEDGADGAHVPPTPPPTAPLATLVVEWAQRDVAANRTRRFLTHTALERGGANVTGPIAPGPAAPPPVELRDAVLTSPSPSGMLSFVARNAPPKDGRGGGTGGSATLEVWRAGYGCILELVVPPGVHGPVYSADGTLATGVAWSGGGRGAEARLAYVAEAPPAEEGPERGRELCGGGEQAAEGRGGAAAAATTPPPPPAAAPPTWRGIGRAQADWGEALAGRRRAAVFLLDIPTGRILRVPGPPPAVPPRPPPAGGGDFDPDAGAVSCGAPTLSPDGRTVVFTAWPHRPVGPFAAPIASRPGLIYCVNRPCSLWATVLPAAGDDDTKKGASPPTCLTPALTSALSPRFAPDGASLVFLSHEAAARSGVHCATAALLRLPWKDNGPNGPPEVVVPVVTTPAAGGPTTTTTTPPPLPPSSSISPTPPTVLAGPFPGLYLTSLPDRPWLDAAGRRLALTSQWGATSEVVVVDLATRAVAPASDRAAFPGAWTFLAAGGGWAAASVSHPARPPEVVLVDCAAASASAAVPAGPRPAWRRLVLGVRGAADSASPSSPPPLLRPPAAAALAGVTWRVLRLPAPAVPLPPTGSTRPPFPPLAGPAPPVEAIVISPPSTSPPSSPPPGLLIPHGGPHSAHADAWVPSLAFLAAAGYAAVLVNFRGSTGYGEGGVQSLPGAVGAADAADCLAALDAAAAAGLVDPARVALVGGSHGGFLAASLAGAHPARFRAAVLRNPVCDLSLMAGLSDIGPDWCFVEAFGSVAGRARARVDATPDDLAALRAVSPMATVASVTAPMLFLLGGGDKRVPAADAQRYVAALRGRPGAPPVRVLLFPEDGHDLGVRPQTEYECWAEVRAWLEEHL